MAKYKVGDKVKVGGHTATIVKILGTSASGEQMYGVKQDDNGWAYESLEGKMKATANAKFKVGQKVARVSDGKVGVIQEAYADGTYAVHVDGEANPNKMPENRIRAVNAKFRVGDRAEFNGVKGTIKSVKEGSGGIPTGYKFKGDNGEMYEPAEGQLKWIKNSAIKSSNPVVANAIKAKNGVATNASPVKPGERCKWRNGPFEWKGVLVSGKPGNYIVKDDDGRQHVWHGNVYHLDEKYHTISTPFGTFYNSKNATNADTEASIDAEANKLYAQLKDIAKKFDALQSRLTKIKVYFYDYKETADGIRGLHGVMR